MQASALLPQVHHVPVGAVFADHASPGRRERLGLGHLDPLQRIPADDDPVIQRHQTVPEPEAVIGDQGIGQALQLEPHFAAVFVIEEVARALLENDGWADGRLDG